MRLRWWATPHCPFLTASFDEATCFFGLMRCQSTRCHRCLPIQSAEAWRQAPWDVNMRNAASSSGPSTPLKPP